MSAHLKTHGADHADGVIMVGSLIRTVLVRRWDWGSIISTALLSRSIRH